MQKDLTKKICILFDHFFNKIYKGSNFKLDLSINNQAKIVESFHKLLSLYYPMPSVDSGFMITYFSFAFSCYSGQSLKRKITLNWIIGKKMLKRFLDRKEETDYYVQQFLKEYDINLDQVRAQLVEQDIENKPLDAAEELEKIRFTGDARLYNCTVNTTMYNHRSPNCLCCEQKSLCKRLLRDIHPRIYKKRGYENIQK